METYRRPRSALSGNQHLSSNFHCLLGLGRGCTRRRQNGTNGEYSIAFGTCRCQGEPLGSETFRHADSIGVPLVKRMLASLLGSRQATSSEVVERVAPTGRVGRVRVGIITIIEEEFEAAKSVFGLHHNVAGTPYFVDDDRGMREWDLALIQASDRSNVPVSADATDFMEDLRPQVMILLGVAGGLCDANNQGRDGIRTGDVVFADQVNYVEFLKIDNNAARVRTYAIDHPSEPLRKNVCAPISKTFNIRDALDVDHQPPDAGAPCKIHVGGIVSAEKVLGDVHSPVQKQLLEPFDKPLAVDMESIGMARAVCHGRGSFWYHPRYVIVRGISDLVADGENNEQRAQWKSFAAHAAALVARQFVQTLPPDIGGI